MAKLAQDRDGDFDTRLLKPAHMRHIRSLASMTEEQLARFIPFVRFIRCQQFDVVCREGDEARSMFLILHGQVRILTEKRRGRPYFLRHLEPGDSFGEIALFDGGRRSATVEAAKDSILLEIEQKTFKRLMTEEPMLANQFLLKVAIQLGGQVRDLTTRLSRDTLLQETLRLIA
jgi:CRP/FNR family cyclic AMP-dependent transcriptional regulator